MKILMAVSSANRFCGGFQNTYNFGRGLADRSHQVTVLSVRLNSNDVKVSEKRKDGLTVCLLKGHKAFGRMFTFAIIPYCRKYLPETDVIYLNGHRNFLSLVMGIFANFYKVPYIIVTKSTLSINLSKTWRQRLLKKVYDKLIGRWLVMNATCVGAVSDREIKDILDYGVAASSIKKVRSGSVSLQALTNTASPGYFREKLNLADKYLIAYVGRIDHFKGLGHLVEAFSMLNDRDLYSVLIAGPDDGFKNELTCLIQALGLTKCVHFVGVLEGEEKFAFYKDVDLVYYAGRFESFGRVALEAIWSETPVIVSKNTDCGEFLGKANGAFLVDYGDVSELKKTITHIRKNPEEASQKIKDGKQYIEDFLSVDKVAVELENTLETIKNKYNNTAKI